MVCFPKWEDSAFNCASRHLEVNAALPSARGFSRERLGPIKLPAVSALILTSVVRARLCSNSASTGVFPSLHLDVNPGGQSRGTPQHQWNSCYREGISLQNQVGQDPSRKGPCDPEQHIRKRSEST